MSALYSITLRYVSDFADFDSCEIYTLHCITSQHLESVKHESHVHTKSEEIFY